MTIRLLALPLLRLLAGCAVDPEDFNVAPHLTPVGSGLESYGPPQAPRDPEMDPFSWEGTNADLFRDPRARRPGDIVTVNIEINDKASLDNNSKRSRESELDAGFGIQADFMAPPTYPWSGSAVADSTSASKGKGEIDRSEKINLSVAALVTNILPNGNIVISGSQEVRVNFEVRVLTIAGIVRPQDISRDNTIPYDKIAEARVSYGGRGRLSEVQQPAFGQQLFDIFTPF